jgi:flagellar motor switch protein FliN/FliY
MKLSTIQDIGVELRVELGRATKSLAEVAGISEGVIIELDKLAGEPVDLLAAGELIAKCEVVVIDENFGVRVTEVVEKETEAVG